MLFHVVISQVWAKEKDTKAQESKVLGVGEGGVSLNTMRVSGKQQILVRWQKTVKGKVEARTFIGFFRKGKEGCGRQFRTG